jgi:DNA-binding phage protein
MGVPSALAPQGPIVDIENVAKIPDIKNTPLSQGMGPIYSGPNIDDLFPSSVSSEGPNIDDLFPDNNSVQAVDESAGFFERVKAGFASNEQEKEAYLKQSYGESNVRKNKDQFEIKENGKWKKFNNEWFGIGDPANLGRQVVVEAAALPAEIMAGTAAGAEALTGVGAPAAIPTLAAGRVVGGAMGEYVARGAANLVGVPRLEKSTKERVVNDAVAALEQGGLRAVFGHIFDRVGMAGSIKKGVSSIAKDLGLVKETAEEALAKVTDPMTQVTMRAIKDINENPLRGIGKEERLQKWVKDAAERQHKSDEVGITVLPNELFPNSPEAQKIVEVARKSKEFNNFRLKRGEEIHAIISEFDKSFSKGGSGNLTNQFSVGKNIDKDLGAKIGGWRDKAIVEAKEFKVPLNKSGTDGGESNFVDAFKEVGRSIGFFDELGDAHFTKKYGYDYLVKEKRSMPTISDLSNTMGMDEKKLSWLHGFMQRMDDFLFNKNQKATMKELDLVRKEIQGQIDLAFDNKGFLRSDYSNKYVMDLIKLKDGARDSFTGNLGQFLNAEERGAFQTDMREFHIVKSSLGELSKLINKNEVTTQGIVDFVTKNPATALDKINSINSVFGKENPQVIESIKSAYWNLFKQKSGYSELSQGKNQLYGDVNPTSVLKHLREDSGSRQIFETLYGKEQAASFEKTMEVLATLRGGDVSQDYVATMSSRLFYAARQLSKLNPGLAIDIFSSNSAARDLIVDGNRNVVLKQIVGKDKSVFEKILNGANNKIKNISRKMSSGVLSQESLDNE